MFSRRTNYAQQFNSTTEDHHFSEENDVRNLNATERIDFNINEENDASDTDTERIDFNDTERTDTSINEENSANDVNTERFKNKETDNAANKPPEADDPESSKPTDNQLYTF